VEQNQTTFRNMTTAAKDSANKVAIITGGSGGIGRVVAKRLASDGFAIAVHYSGNPAKAEAVVAEIENAGGEAIAVQADVTKAGDVENLFKQALEAFGKIDVVVHSAGIMPLFPITDGDVESFDKVMATNLRGTFLVLGQAAQHVPAGAASSRSQAASLLNLFRNMAPMWLPKRAWKAWFEFWPMNYVGEI
jgi:3-oxoacyl-[acyl-carrier protein] reductase